jgi:hypothetical protein
MNYLSLFLFCTALWTAQPGDANIVTGTGEESVGFCLSSLDPLDCYLEQLIIEFPSTLCAPLNDDGSQYLCLNDLVCSDITLGAVPSSYKTHLTLAISAVSLGAHCTSNWNATFSERIEEEGKVEITVSDADIVVGLLFGKNATSLLPNSTSFSYCDLPNIEVSSDFTGLNRIFNAIAQRAINQIIPSALDELVCVKLASFLAVNVTQTIVDTVEPSLISVIESLPSVSPVFPGAISWVQSNFVNLFQMVVHVVNFKDDDSNDVPSIITAFITKLTNGTGTLEFNIEESIELPYMRIYLDSIVLSGLDSISSLAALVPNKESNISLDFGIIMDHLDLELSIRIQLENSTHTQNYRIFMTMLEVDLSVTLDLAISETAIGNLYVGQLGNSECILSTIDYVAFSSIDMATYRDNATTGTFIKSNIIFLMKFYLNEVTNPLVLLISDYFKLRSIGIEPVSVYEQHTLESDLVTIVNQTLFLFTEDFSEFLSDLVGGVLQGQFRSKVNEKLIALYENIHDCPEYEQKTEPNYLDWRTSAVVETIDNFINEKLGYNGINKAIYAATEGTSSVNIQADSGVNVTIGGLNSFYEFMFLVPKPLLYALGNQFSLGFCDHRSQFFLIFSIYYRVSQITLNSNSQVEASIAMQAFYN